MPKPLAVVEILWVFLLLSAVGLRVKLSRLGDLLVERGMVARGQRWSMAIIALLVLNALALTVLEVELWMWVPLWITGGSGGLSILGVH